MSFLYKGNSRPLWNKAWQAFVGGSKDLLSSYLATKAVAVTTDLDVASDNTFSIPVTESGSIKKGHTLYNKTASFGKMKMGLCIVAPTDIVPGLGMTLLRGGVTVDEDYDMANVFKVNKFGRSKNCDNNTLTDIWSKSDQPIWLAPTAARIHAIVSSSASDAAAAVGAQVVKIYGLTSWSEEEISEEVTLNGTTAVNTTNAYVIIHRMKVISSGATAINVGTITATAAVDTTVTAQIDPEIGQTLMAIYGVPEGRTVNMSNYYCSAIRGSASFSVEVFLLVNPDPENSLHYLVKNAVGVTTEGNNYISQVYDPKYAITGPAIIKIQVEASLDNAEVSAGFNLE